MPERLIAQGTRAFAMMHQLGRLRYRLVTTDGVVNLEPGTEIQPRVIYWTTTGQEIVYLRNNGLYGAPILEFTRGHSGIGPFTRELRAGTAFTRDVVIPGYRNLMSLVQNAFPGGRNARLVVQFVSVGMFYQRHQREIDQAIARTSVLLGALRALCSNCPILAGLLLRGLVEDTYNRVATQVEQQGVARTILSQIDTEQLGRDVAGLLGKLLRGALRHPGDQGNPIPLPRFLVNLLGHQSIERLTRVIPVVSQIRSALRTQQIARTLRPQVDDPEQLASALVRNLGEAGRQISQQQAREVVREGCVRDEEKLRQLEMLATNAEQFHRLVVTLSNAYEREVFRS